MVPEKVEDEIRSLTVTRPFSYEYDGKTVTLQPGDYRATPMGTEQGVTPPPTPDVNWVITQGDAWVAVLPAHVAEARARDGTLSFSA